MTIQGPVKLNRRSRELGLLTRYGSSGWLGGMA